MFTLIIFILILSLLVFVHELGHFLAARKMGMKVHEFGIGFPPRAFGWYKNPKTGKRVWVWGSGKSNLKKTVVGEEVIEDEFPNTFYSINWLPLGGFVKIKGENGENAKDKDSFGYHKAWKRIVVLSAGVLMNFLLAAVVLGIGFMIGLPSDVSMLEDKSAIVVGDPHVVVQQVEKDSPAERAGVEFGDQILSINNEIILQSARVSDLVQQYGEEEITLAIIRNEEKMEINMKPEAIDGHLRIGVLLVDAAIVRYPWYISFFKGFSSAVYGVINIVLAFYILFKNLILGQGLAFEVSGPVGIAVVIGQSARLGFNYLLNVIAMISLSLAVINILPIPALDGGRILFVIIEKIFRRPAPMKYEQLAHTLGFALLMLLIIIITWRDVAGLF